MSYLHVDVTSAQSSRRPGAPCGDVVVQGRTAGWTGLVCCDGIGHGVKAYVAATMTSARLMELLRGGMSVQRAVSAVVKTMGAARGTPLPWAAFTAAQIAGSGQATVVTYEMPAPILATRRHASALKQRATSVGTEIVSEAHCHLEPGEGLLVVTDGITQAGLGTSAPRGWGIDGAVGCANEALARGRPATELPKLVHRGAMALCGEHVGDDATAVLAYCREGRVVTVLTGPPSDRGRDKDLVRRFMLDEGAKVVCGASTAEMVARLLGAEVTVEQRQVPSMAPPRYAIEGIDLVTEGAVTLNQLCNVLDADADELEPDTGVTALRALLDEADRVNFLVGSARNPGHAPMRFRQMGMMARARIVPLIAEKLEEQGKLVVIEHW